MIQLIQNCINGDTYFLNKMSEFYGEISNHIQTLSTNAYKYEVFGKRDKAEETYNRINNFHYLYFLLMRMYEQRRMNELLGVFYTDRYYIEQWCLECIIDQFQCWGYNIIPLLEIFGLDYTGSNDDTGDDDSTDTDDSDGIGNSSIIDTDDKDTDKYDPERDLSGTDFTIT